MERSKSSKKGGERTTEGRCGNSGLGNVRNAGWPLGGSDHYFRCHMATKKAVEKKEKTAVYQRGIKRDRRVKDLAGSSRSKDGETAG